MNNQNLLIKASIAAKQLGKSSTTIRRMLADGRLLGEKNGARYWVNRASLEQFIETGDGRIDQTELKSNTESDISGLYKLLQRCTIDPIPCPIFLT